jgi:Tol biopolymer transport system component
MPGARLGVLAGVIAVLATASVVAAGIKRSPSSPPGSIAFETTRGQHVEIVVASGSGAHQRLLLHASDLQQYQPSWSRDGRHLAFVGLVHGDPTTAEILLSTPSGAVMRQLTHNMWEDDFPSWSPDGRRIAFYSSRPAGTGIYLMDSDGRHQELLAGTSAAVSWAPAWSPDGTRIAFVSGIASRAELFTIQPNGYGIKQLTHDALFDTDPAWSPSGRRLAFARTLKGRTQIWVMNSDGSDQRRLTGGAGNQAWGGATHPTWSADGRWIAFGRTDSAGHSRIYLATAEGRERPLAGAYARGGSDPSFSPADA